LSHLPRAKITATLTGEKADIPVRLQQVEPNLYKAVYTPTIGGPYTLEIFADNRPLKDSPYRVDVRSFNSPAELIEVDARTLKIGILGEDVKTVIDARKATAGHLSAQCQGPVNLEYCEIYDNRDGTYILRISPKELGRHVLSIKYDNEHVNGSPFIFNVANAPDASKVKVYGPGIEHGILAK
jgi:filamin